MVRSNYDLNNLSRVRSENFVEIEDLEAPNSVLKTVNCLIILIWQSFEQCLNFINNLIFAEKDIVIMKMGKKDKRQKKIPKRLQFSPDFTQNVDSAFALRFVRDSDAEDDNSPQCYEHRLHDTSNYQTIDF